MAIVTSTQTWMTADEKGPAPYQCSCCGCQTRHAVTVNELMEQMGKRFTRSYVLCAYDYFSGYLGGIPFTLASCSEWLPE